MEGKTYKRNVTIASLLMFAVLFVIYFVFHQKTQYTAADNSSMFQVMLDFFGGNYLMKHWIVSTSSFMFTDSIWFLPGLLLGIHAPTLMSFCGAVFHAGFVAVMLYLLLMGEREKIRSPKVAVIVSVIYLMLFAVIPYAGYTMENPVYLYLNLNEHSGTYLFVVLEILLLHLWRESDYKKKRYPIIFTIYGILGLMSDSTSLMVLYGPLCVYSAYFLIWPKVERNRKKDLFLIGDSIAIVVISSLINKVIKNMGGMTIRGIGLALLDKPSMIDHAKKLIIKILLLFGYDNRYGLQINASFIIACLVSGMVLVSLIYQVIIALKSKPDRLGLLLSIGIVSNMVGFVFINTGFDAASRYIMAMPFYGTALIVKFVLAIMSEKQKLGKAVIAVALVISMAFGIYHLIGMRNVPRYADDGEAVAEYIRQKGGGNGFGALFIYTAISAYTDFDSTIVPIWWDGGPWYYTHYVLLNEEWYKLDDIHYVVIQSDPNDPYSEFGLRDEFLRIAGEPDEDVVFGQYEILYYENTDLSEFEYSPEFEDEYLRSVGLR